MTLTLAAVAALPIVLALVMAMLVFRRRPRPPRPPSLGPGVLGQLLLAAPIRLWALILAGPPLTAFAVWLAWLVRYGWSAEHAQQQLEILGSALFGALGLIAVIVVALAAVRLEAETRLGKFMIRGDDDDAPPAAEGAP